MVERTFKEMAQLFCGSSGQRQFTFEACLNFQEKRCRPFLDLFDISDLLLINVYTILMPIIRRPSRLIWR